MSSKIKELNELGDFKRIYRVFSGPPYNEKYTDEELEEIFREYQEKGYIYGVYKESQCVGLIALERGAKSNQPIKFENGKKIMYLADVAVLEKYRKKGLGNQLMLYGVMQSKLMGYQKLYMRTLEKGSMSKGIALRLGFKQIPYIYQNVERERTNGRIETVKNIFLEIDLDSLSKETLKQSLEIVNPIKVEEREG